MVRCVIGPAVFTKGQWNRFVESFKLETKVFSYRNIHQGKCRASTIDEYRDVVVPDWVEKGQDPRQQDLVAR